MFRITFKILHKCKSYCKKQKICVCMRKCMIEKEKFSLKCIEISYNF